jgi:DNA polymerase-3 subunit beta
MRRVMVVSDKTTTLIKFLFEANKVTLTSEDINYAQSAEEQLVCQYDGQPLKMGFKGSDLLELIGNLQSQEMTLKLADPSKAGLILPSEQDEGTDLLMLLMPLLINN